MNLFTPGATVTSRLAHRDESAILIKSLGPLPVRRLPVAALGRAYGRRRCSWVPVEVSLLPFVARSRMALPSPSLIQPRGVVGGREELSTKDTAISGAPMHL